MRNPFFCALTLAQPENFSASTKKVTLTLDQVSRRCRCSPLEKLRSPLKGRYAHECEARVVCSMFESEAESLSRTLYTGREHFRG